MIRYKCPGCGVRLQSPESLIGLKDACFNCGRQVRVPVRSRRSPALVIGILAASVALACGAVGALVYVLATQKPLPPLDGPGEPGGDVPAELAADGRQVGGVRGPAKTAAGAGQVPAEAPPASSGPFPVQPGQPNLMLLKTPDEQIWLGGSVDAWRTMPRRIGLIALGRELAELDARGKCPEIPEKWLATEIGSDEARPPKAQEFTAAKLSECLWQNGFEPAAISPARKAPLSQILKSCPDVEAYLVARIGQAMEAATEGSHEDAGMTFVSTAFALYDRSLRPMGAAMAARLQPVGPRTQGWTEQKKASEYAEAVGVDVAEAMEEGFLAYLQGIWMTSDVVGRLAGAGQNAEPLQVRQEGAGSVPERASLKLANVGRSICLVLVEGPMVRRIRLAPRKSYQLELAPGSYKIAVVPPTEGGKSLLANEVSLAAEKRYAIDASVPE